MIGGGTSCATPTATAAAALLISAAKQEGVQWSASRLRYAIYSTARPLEGIPTYQQGRGVIQIGKAWEALKALDKIHDWVPPQIDVSAPVKTVSSHFLATPDRGVGIFEREGWRAHQKGTREIVLTRRNGPVAPVTYELQWQGDSAAFDSAKSVSLPLNQPVKLPIEITTQESGAYSAILRLREPGMPVEALSILNTVMAAEALDNATGYSLRRELPVRRPGVNSVFVSVAPGTTALQIKLSKDSPETLALHYLPPDSDHVGYYKLALRRGTKQLIVPRPSPGVWELMLDNRMMQRDDSKFIRDLLGGGEFEPRPQPLTPTAVTLEVKLIRADVQFNRAADQIELHNFGAPLTGSPFWSGFGSEYHETTLLHAGDQKHFKIQVPDGSKLLKVDFTDLSDPVTDVSLLVYEVKQGKAALRDSIRGPDAPLVSVIPSPGAGEWIVVVDAYATPGAGVRGLYRDLIVHDAFGTLKPAEKTFSLSTDATWSTTLTAEPAAMPTAPRQLVEVLLFGTLLADIEKPGSPDLGAQEFTEAIAEVSESGSK